MLKQLSIFAENKRGTMTKLTGVLAREEISILGSVTNDSAEYGIIRMIVTDPQKACQALLGLLAYDLGYHDGAAPLVCRHHALHELHEALPCQRDHGPALPEACAEALAKAEPVRLEGA